MSVAAMTWAWKQDLDPTDKFILLALADHSNDEDFTCWPSLAHLQRKTGYSRPTVWKSIDRLIKANAVQRVGESAAGSTRYKVMVGNELTLGKEVTQVTRLPKVGNQLNRVGNVVNKVGNQLTPNHQEPSLTITEPSEMDDFELAFASYPKRQGGNPKPPALKAFKARLKEGYTAYEIRQGVERYRAFCEATGISKTSYVMQAKRFFGPDKSFNETWQVHPGQPSRSGKKTVADYRAALQASIESPEKLTHD